MTTPTQPPVLLTPAAQPADTGGSTTGGSTTTVAGSITLNIANHTFTLTGTLGQHMIVEYHAAFEDSISLGSISDIATAIANAFNFSGTGGTGGIDTEITTVSSSLNSVPVLKEIYGVFTHAQIRITDLEINTQTSTYGVGLAMDFTQLPPGVLPQGQTVPTLLGIELLSLGFKVTKVNPNPPTGS